MNDLVEIQSRTAYTRPRSEFSAPSRRYAGETAEFMVEIPEGPGLARISLADLALVLRQSHDGFADTVPTRSFTRTMFMRREGVFETIAGVVGPPPLRSSVEPAFASLVRALDAEIVEDGEPHSAETTLAEFVRIFRAGPLLQALFAETFRPSRTASFLRLLGRIQAIPPRDRRRLVERGLASACIEVRDAAIQAVESWHDSALAELLMSHNESEPWLADYARAVAGDLT